MKKILLILLILGNCIAAKAQYSKDNPRALGDKAFNNKDWYEAAYYYRKAAEGMSLITQQSIPYTGGGKSVKKEKKALSPKKGLISVFAWANHTAGTRITWKHSHGTLKVLEENHEAQYPLSRLWYGVCLRATQNFDEAIKQLTQFNQAYKGDANTRPLPKRRSAIANLLKSNTNILC
jgi:OOP family OmpA-OmpF porin